MITEAQIQVVVRRIVEGNQPDRIVLFGPYAHGTPTESSELDLSISRQNAEAKRVARAVTVRQLLWGTDAPAMDSIVRAPEEMVSRTALHYTAGAPVVQEGRIVYAAPNA